MLLDDNQKKLQFYNNNGLLDDPKTINEETVSKTNYWTDTEKELFHDKYLHRPKNFGYIASALHNKVCCCLFHKAVALGPDGGGIWGEQFLEPAIKSLKWFFF